MDPIADFLTIIKNGYQAKKEQVTAPMSKAKKTIADILARAGYIESVEDTIINNHPALLITLRYINKEPAVYKIKRISKPSVRIYKQSNRIPKTLSGAGITIVSTSSGILTDKEARQKHLGGEIICQVW